MRLALDGILQVLGRQFLKADVVRCVAGGHQMIVVQALQERLDLGLLLQLVLAHLLGHLARVPVDAGNERMSEGLLRRAIIGSLHNDSFAAGVTSTKDDYDLALFHNFPHLGSCACSKQTQSIMLLLLIGSDVDGSRERACKVNIREMQRISTKSLIRLRLRFELYIVRQLIALVFGFIIIL